MKTIQEMAREAGIRDSLEYDHLECTEQSLEAFAKLVREDERERIAKWYESEGHMMFPVAIPEAIRSNT